MTISHRANFSEHPENERSLKMKLHKKIQSFSLIEVLIGGSMTLLCFCVFCYIIISYVRRLHRSGREDPDSIQRRKAYEEDDNISIDPDDQESKHFLLPRQ